MDTKTIDGLLKIGAGGPGSGRHKLSSTEELKTAYSKTYAHLLARSREAELNTGDPAGEYGTLHSLKQESPSKFQGALEHALVHHSATSMGPDMAYNKTGRLTAQVRKAVPNGDVVGAFEKGTLDSHVEPLALGRKSDRYREAGDRYY